MEKKTIWDLNRPDLETSRSLPKMPLTLVLDNVRSLNNIGALFRTSDALAVKQIFLCGISQPPPSPEIHKTALGAEESVAWRYFPSTSEAVRELQAQGVLVCCLEQVKGSVSLLDFKPDPSREYALVAGHEVDGVDPEIVNLCNFCLEIPQKGIKHSLNVSVATAIAIWQFYQTLYYNI